MSPTWCWLIKLQGGNNEKALSVATDLYRRESQREFFLFVYLFNYENGYSGNSFTSEDILGVSWVIRQRRLYEHSRVRTRTLTHLLSANCIIGGKNTESVVSIYVRWDWGIWQDYYLDNWVYAGMFNQQDKCVFWIT